MTRENDKIRELVIDNYKAKKTVEEISKFLSSKVSKSTIEKWVKVYKQDGRRTPNNHLSGRKKKVLTQKKVRAIEKLILDNETSLRGISKRLEHVSARSVGRVADAMGVKVI